MRISVVIPTYNRRHVLGRAIDSALHAGTDDVEVLVVDDGSSDGTVEWLAQAYAGRPVEVLRNGGKKGPAGARNTGIRAARSELIALLDSDDSFLPGHLSAAGKAFDRFAELDVVFGRARYVREDRVEDYMGPNFARKLDLAPKRHVDADLVVFGDAFFEHLLEFGCWFNLSSVVMRRTAALPGMNEDLRISEDYEYWVRLSRKHRFGCLTQEQILYLLHDENISFEADASSEQHAPRLLQALDVMRAYSGLTPRQQHLIDAQAADILFDWAYRCRLASRWRAAAALHWRSLQRGRRAANAAALLKLPLLALSRGAAARAARMR